MNKRRVVITGMGAVSPLGIGVDMLWQGFMNSKSGIDYIKRFDTTNFPTTFAGEVNGFDPLNWISKREVRQMDRFIQLAIAASDETMKDAGLKVSDEMAPRFASIIGVGVGASRRITVTWHVGRG